MRINLVARDQESAHTDSRACATTPLERTLDPAVLVNLIPGDSNALSFRVLVTVVPVDTMTHASLTVCDVRVRNRMNIATGEVDVVITPELRSLDLNVFSCAGLTTEVRAFANGGGDGTNSGGHGGDDSDDSSGELHVEFFGIEKIKRMWIWYIRAEKQVWFRNVKECRGL